MTVTIGSQWKLDLYFVEVTGFTPKSRFVFYRRLGSQWELERRLSLARWLREGQPA